MTPPKRRHRATEETKRRCTMPKGWSRGDIAVQLRRACGRTETDARPEEEEEEEEEQGEDEAPLVAEDPEEAAAAAEGDDDDDDDPCRSDTCAHQPPQTRVVVRQQEGKPPPAMSSTPHYLEGEAPTRAAASAASAGVATLKAMTMGRVEVMMSTASLREQLRRSLPSAATRRSPMPTRPESSAAGTEVEPWPTSLKRTTRSGIVLETMSPRTEVWNVSS
mmetsp:Transcript_5190/g.21387  ORF Transcript_5190/g.21387 Transcript_5190/m.21387 type:complete len:220 (-) Transcript_5190:309-968(-)